MPNAGRLVLLAMIAALGALALLAGAPQRQASADAPNYKDASYEIQGRVVTLSNGVSDIESTPSSASRITTRYFGNEASGDLNGDGDPDVGFLLTQSTGGTGTFYYAVAALKAAGGYLGTNAVLLGDRVAPQTTQILPNGTLVVNYADRKPGDAMTTAPSVGVSKYLRVVGGRLVEVAAPISPVPPTPPKTGNGGLFPSITATSRLTTELLVLVLVGVVAAARLMTGIKN